MSRNKSRNSGNRFSDRGMCKIESLPRSAIQSKNRQSR
jgi:hypothetical protein